MAGVLLVEGGGLGRARVDGGGHLAVGGHEAKAVRVSDGEVVEPPLERGVFRDGEVRLPVTRVEGRAVHEANAHALIARSAQGNRRGGVALSGARAAGHGEEHAVVGERDLEQFLVDDAHEVGERLLERRVLPHRLGHERVVVSREQKHKAVLPAQAPEHLQQRGLEVVVGLRRVEEVARAEHRVDLVALGLGEDSLEHVAARAREGLAGLGAKAGKTSAQVPVGGVEQLEHDVVLRAFHSMTRSRSNSVSRRGGA